MIDIGKDLQRAYEEGYKQGRYDERVESEIYVCEGANSTERTFGEIMGIMSMASEMENIAISEKSEPSEHDGCKDCKHSRKEKWEEPCLKCKMNYTDKWEKRDD